MEIRERTPEQKLERYQAMLFVAIANEMRMKFALQDIITASSASTADAIVVKDIATRALAELELIPGMGKR